LPYERDERFGGKTKYQVGKMLRFAIDAISGFSIVPLRAAVYLGFICAIIGMIFFGYTVYSYLTGIAIHGWTTLMTVVLILGSSQLLVLGVVGEYLGRLYIQSKNRPLFIIEEVVRGGPQDAEPQQDRVAVKNGGPRNRRRSAVVRMPSTRRGQHSP